jgi:hypothetical protein
MSAQNSLHPDIQASPQTFLRQLFEAAVTRALPLENTPQFLPAGGESDNPTAAAGMAAGIGSITGTANRGARARAATANGPPPITIVVGPLEFATSDRSSSRQVGRTSKLPPNLITVLGMAVSEVALITPRIQTAVMKALRGR